MSDAERYEPMPRRPTGVLTRVIAPVSSGVRETEAQREPRAAFWDEQNRAALEADGPLWIAFGDSSTQGIGAADPHDSWAWRVLELLRSEIDPSWRLLNLSITGAQYGDVIEHQLPRLDQRRAADDAPSLVTLLAGANNLMAPGTWPSLTGEVRTTLSALPHHSVVARTGVSGMANSIMARRINTIVHEFADQRSFHLFWPWDWPSRDGMGADKWHPSEIGYGYMTDLIWPQVQASLTARNIGL